MPFEKLLKALNLVGEAVNQVRFTTVTRSVTSSRIDTRVSQLGPQKQIVQSIAVHVAGPSDTEGSTALATSSGIIRFGRVSTEVDR